MKLCMFHPVDHPLGRGWVGRVDGDHVVQLAAQTLESYFTGGGTAREHAVYPLAGVRFLPPVLHPPAIRVFEDEASFAFANPAAVVGPDATITAGGHPLALLTRLAAVIGSGGIGGFTAFCEWRQPNLAPPKDRDFAFGLGPVVATGDELPQEMRVAVRVDGAHRLDAVVEPFAWGAACGVAAEGTVLRPGDILACPAFGVVEPIAAGHVELELEGIGTLRQEVR
jgi:Fumarylacetoacetate (FAA) hydrolase family